LYCEIILNSLIARDLSPHKSMQIMYKKNKQEISHPVILRILHRSGTKKNKREISQEEINRFGNCSIVPAATFIVVIHHSMPISTNGFSNCFNRTYREKAMHLHYLSACDWATTDAITLHVGSLVLNMPWLFRIIKTNLQHHISPLQFCPLPNMFIDIDVIPKLASSR